MQNDASKCFVISVSLGTVLRFNALVNAMTKPRHSISKKGLPVSKNRPLQLRSRFLFFNTVAYVLSFRTRSSVIRPD